MREKALPQPPAESDPAVFDEAFVSLDSVEEREVEWLIQGYIPKSSIVILAADGGVGKTFTWCHILAKRTRGDPTVFEHDLFPEYIAPEGNVVFFTGEDSVSKVLKKRLRQAGADMQKVKTILPSHPMFQRLSLESEAIEYACKAFSPQIIVFDPLQAFVTAKTDMASRSEMRAQFKALTALAEKYETTFLLVCHSNKRRNASGRERIADSADVWDVARSVLMAGRSGDEIHFSHEKCSYGRLEPTILCEIQGNQLIYIGTSEKRDADYIAERASNAPSAVGGIVQAEIEEFIVDYLREAGEARGGDLMDACKAEGFKDKTVVRARTELKKRGIINKRSVPIEGSAGRQWVWFLNPDATIPWE